MVFLFVAILYGGGGAVVGGLFGCLAGALLRAVDAPGPKARRPGVRSSSGCGTVAGGVGLGALVGGAVGIYLGYSQLNSDGPPHGYPDRPSYRAAEMQARTAQLDPIVAALAKYKADKGAYPTHPDELVTGKYLAALPPSNPLDHLGSPQRVGPGILKYYLSPDADQYALELSCPFSEDRRGMGYHSEIWANDSRNSGWHPGSHTQGWRGRDVTLPPAPERRRDEK